MAPRGEVGIVVVTLGLGLGLLTQDLFSAVLIAVVLTTVAAPIMLNAVIPRAAEEADASTAPVGPGTRTARSSGTRTSG
jgi:Kef-type K+ transport system membrane component KefB